MVPGVAGAVLVVVGSEVAESSELVGCAIGSEAAGMDPGGLDPTGVESGGADPGGADGAGNVWTVGVAELPGAVGVGWREDPGLEDPGLEDPGLEDPGLEVAGSTVAGPRVGALAGSAECAPGPVAESPAPMVCRCNAGRSVSADGAWVVGTVSGGGCADGPLLAAGSG